MLLVGSSQKRMKWVTPCQSWVLSSVPKKSSRKEVPGARHATLIEAPPSRQNTFNGGWGSSIDISGFLTTAESMPLSKCIA